EDFIEDGDCVRCGIDRLIELVCLSGESLAGVGAERVAATTRDGGSAGEGAWHVQRCVHALGEKQATGAERPPHAWLEHIH
ncbi:jg2162, partial [Pararge aegeria aegeria]